MFYTKIFSFGTSLDPNHYDYIKFPLYEIIWDRSLLTYGSFMFAGVVWWRKPVNLGEPVQSHITQSFIYRGVYCFTKPRKETADIWYGMELNQYFWNNQPLRFK